MQCNPFGNAIHIHFKGMHLHSFLPKHFQKHSFSVFCQGMSAEKLSISQTTLSIWDGDSITVTPLLALGADQMAKISLADNGCGPVYLFHLDDLCSSSSIDALQAKLHSLSNNTSTCIDLYASPQVLLRNDAQWISLLLELWDKPLLCLLLCIDELHLYLGFGHTFQMELCF